MGVRVLIVEPDKALAEAYGRYLSRVGFDLEMAGGLTEVADKAVQFAPHAIVLELDLADSHRKCRWDPHSAMEGVPSIPIVILSRLDQSESGIAIKWPVVEYFVKPVPMARLTQALRNVDRRKASGAHQPDLRH